MNECDKTYKIDFCGMVLFFDRFLFIPYTEEAVDKNLLEDTKQIEFLDNDIIFLFITILWMNL